MQKWLGTMAVTQCVYMMEKSLESNVCGLAAQQIACIQHIFTI